MNFFIFSYKISSKLWNFTTFYVINYYSIIQEFQSVQAEGVKKTGRKRTLPPRNTQIQSLKSESFDVLIIGGGATGAGCAIDSVTRGKIYFYKFYINLKYLIYFIYLNYKIIVSCQINDFQV